MESPARNPKSILLASQLSLKHSDSEGAPSSDRLKLSPEKRSISVVIDDKSQLDNAINFNRTSLRTIRSTSSFSPTKLLAAGSSIQDDAAFDGDENDEQQQQLKPQYIHKKIDDLPSSEWSIQNKDASEIFRLIMQRQPVKRTAKEVSFLRECLREVIFLKGLEETMSEASLLRLCKFLSYESYPRCHRLYKAGEFGRKFYIILEGSVFIMMPSIKQSLLNPPPDTSTAATSQQISSEILQLLRPESVDSVGTSLRLQPLQLSPVKSLHRKRSMEQVDEEEIIKKTAEKENEGFYIKKMLSKGSGFGEIALRTEGIRTATVVCKEPTQFLSIAASSYCEIIDPYYDKLYGPRLDFLKSVSVFSRWDLNLLHEVMLQMNVKILKRGDTVFEEGDKSSHLYFVRHGAVELQQEFQVEGECDGLKKIPEKLLRTNSVWNEKARSSRTKKVCMVVIGPQQYFGDYEIFKKTKRTTKAVCSENSEIYSLEKKDFFENMRFLSMMQGILSFFKDRESWYGEMIQNYKQPDKGKQKQKHSNSLYSKQDEGNIDSFRESFNSRMQQYQSPSPVKRVESPSKLAEMESGESLRKIELKQQQQKSNTFSMQFYASSHPSMSSIDANTLVHAVTIKKPVATDVVVVETPQKAPHRPVKSQHDRHPFPDYSSSEEPQVIQQALPSEVENILKLRKFVGKSLNLIGHIETARTERLHPTFHSEQNAMTSPRMNRTKYPSFDVRAHSTLPTLGNHQSSRGGEVPDDKDLTTPLTHSSQNAQRVPPQQPLYSQSSEPPARQTFKPTSKQAVTIYRATPIEEIDGVAKEVKRSQQDNPPLQDSFQFIKNQLSAQKKTLGQIKQEGKFKHRYFSEKTGRYQIPDMLVAQYIANISRLTGVDFNYKADEKQNEVERFRNEDPVLRKAVTYAATAASKGIPHSTYFNEIRKDNPQFEDVRRFHQHSHHTRYTSYSGYTKTTEHTLTHHASLNDRISSELIRKETEKGNNTDIKSYNQEKDKNFRLQSMRQLAWSPSRETNYSAMFKQGKKQREEFRSTEKKRKGKFEQ